jgi:hypothetical protein
MSIAISACVLPYLWGLVAPPTKVEKQEEAQLGNIAAQLRTVLENQKTDPQQVRQFVNQQGFEYKYPLAIALFYANKKVILDYGTQNASGVSAVTLEPSRIRVTKITQSEICVSELSIVVQNWNQTWNVGWFFDNDVCFSTLEGGSLHVFFPNAHPQIIADIIPLGNTSDGTAWMIGVGYYSPPDPARSLPRVGISVSSDHGVVVYLEATRRTGVNGGTFRAPLVTHTIRPEQ